ncbi:MAG TPA: M56 family metallopeptidase [Saprospiraceae bacterium]|nr:M56 family metallopeptidase [Saprospiraceae bacterium]
MTQLYTFLGDELVNALGWTFVHSLWQGSLVALIMTALMSRIPAQQAQKRYIIATISLISVLFCSMVTFAFLYQQPTVAATGNDAFLTGIAAETEAVSMSLYAWISQFNPFLVSIWIMGVLFFALRFCFGLFYLRHLKASASATPAEWQETLDRIIKTLGFTRKVKLAQSALLKIPVVAGYLKPVILFPVGIINQLQVDEVEAILAHEVAHLVRNDFLQNLVQSLIEMIFYYHPAVWWISAVARSERENCCDDLAVQVCSSSLTYAKALVRLEDISYHAPALALPFAGSKGHLLNRIKRILNQPQNKSNVMERIIATAILIGCVTLLSFSERHAQSLAEAEDVNVGTQYPYAIADTVPVQREITVWKTVDGKEMEMRSQNGEIKSLKIDGNVIDPSEYPTHEAEIEEMRAIATDTPPLPPMPPIPPFPPLEPVAPVPPMPPLPDMPPMPPMPDMPDIPEPMLFDHQLFTPQPSQEGRTNKTTIIRERSGNGYSYHVESEGNTNVEIDGDRGIAIINGQEIELDADSVIVIEKEERNGYGLARTPRLFYSDDVIVQRDVIRDSIPAVHYKMLREKMTEAQKAEWEAYENAMKDWGKEWEKAAEGMKWDEYSKQMEEWGKQWENQDWKAYEDQWKQYGAQWEKEHAGEWKEYGEQMQDYARQLAEAERQSVLGDRHLQDELRQQRREQMEGARMMELEHARILQLDEEGNLFAPHPRHSREPFGPITSAMERDGLIDTNGEYSIILEEDRLRINGKRMSDDVHEKYLDLFERTQGYRISGKSKIEISN